MITTWKLAPCIAAGNVLIIKAAELTPLYASNSLSSSKPGSSSVVNIITGLGTVTGRDLSEHMSVSKIAFTGSGTAGRQIIIAAAKSNLKKVTIELGGKSASIIFDYADFDNALFWRRWVSQHTMARFVS